MGFKYPLLGCQHEASNQRVQNWVVSIAV